MMGVLVVRVLVLAVDGKHVAGLAVNWPRRSVTAGTSRSHVRGVDLVVAPAAFRTSGPAPGSERPGGEWDVTAGDRCRCFACVVCGPGFCVFGAWTLLSSPFGWLHGLKLEPRIINWFYVPTAIRHGDLGGGTVHAEPAGGAAGDPQYRLLTPRSTDHSSVCGGGAAATSGHVWPAWSQSDGGRAAAQTVDAAWYYTWAL